MAGELDLAEQLLRRAADDEAAAKALLPVKSVTDVIVEGNRQCDRVVACITMAKVAEERFDPALLSDEDQFEIDAQAAHLFQASQPRDRRLRRGRRPCPGRPARTIPLRRPHPLSPNRLLRSVPITCRSIPERSMTKPMTPEQEYAFYARPENQQPQGPPGRTAALRRKLWTHSCSWAKGGVPRYTKQIAQDEQRAPGVVARDARPRGTKRRSRRLDDAYFARRLGKGSGQSSFFTACRLWLVRGAARGVVPRLWWPRAARCSSRAG